MRDNLPKKIRYESRIYEKVCLIEDASWKIKPGRTKEFNNSATVNVTAVDLLSVKEAEQLPRKILRYRDMWWLQDTGRDPRGAVMFVWGINGEIDYEGAHPGNPDVDVRPAFTIPELKSLNLSIGDKVLLDDISCIVISDDKILYNDKEIFYRFEGLSPSINYAMSEIKKRFYPTDLTNILENKN